MDSNTRVLLEIDKLSVAFRSEEGWKTVIHDVSLSLKRGESLGVVGESGSGKTVSSLACMGLLPPGISRIEGGSIRFEGSDLLANEGAAAQAFRGSRMAMVFQEPMSALNPSMRCGEQVAEAVRLHRKLKSDQAHTVVTDLFAEVELPNPEAMYARYPHELSGGQKQRVMIALALAGDPSLLIADEPTTALDVTVQASILKLLRRLREERGLAMLFISHDLDVVARVADRVAVMWNGRVVELGPTERLLTHPEHPYTRGLLACKPPVTGARTVLPTVSDVLENRTVQAHSFAINTGSEPIVQVRNVSKSFVTRRNLFGRPTAFFEAVRGVSFDVIRGETLGIVGESGCGKSTLSRMVMQLLKPDSGDIVYLTSKRGGGPAVQLVFQDPFSSLNPRITAVGCLIEALTVSGVCSDKRAARSKALALMAEVGLPEAFADRYPHAFSGGQRQRLVIARALCTEPEVLILDESVAALDISVQAQVLNLLNRLKEERNLTYIFISHDLRVVRFMSDRVLVMYKGKIEELGPAQAVMEHPRSAYTQKLVAGALGA
ncbi:MAG: dipeptide ABC transporter ATP-binding protein [Flavobacteriales bacterium]